MTKAATVRIPDLTEQAILNTVVVRLLTADELERERYRYRQLMTAHHYLKSDQLVGEQLRFVAEVDGQWVDYLLPIKENHEGLLQRAQQTLPTPEKAQPAAQTAGPSPLRPKRATNQPSQNATSTTSPAPVRYRRDRRKKPLTPRKAQPASRSDQP